MQPLNTNKLPRHIAVIMDGNGRWAKEKGAARIFGHRNAIKSVREVTERCAEIGINYLTLYAFSTENWNRPQLEVKGLMSLLVSTIRDEISTLMDNNVQLLSIGDLSKLPSDAYKNLLAAKKKTENNTGLKLVLALNYSGRWDIGNAIQQILQRQDLDSGDFNVDLFESYLSTNGIPDPELLIRTSGEMRISNFLLWQLAYTELYFTDVLWPDFRKQHLDEAIVAYQGRERRFGKTSEQLMSEESK